MVTTFQRSMSVLVCTFLFNLVSFAQEKETPKTPTPAPVEQPKATPTNKEQKPITPIADKKDDGGTGDGGTGDGDDKDKDPKDKSPKDGLASSVSGGQAAGTSPTASPETAFQNNIGDIPVNTFTGTAGVPIPIYTLKEGNLSVPITLYHNASGVRAHDVAAWTGMNTTISAGAFLSKIVRGIPDEGKLEYVSYGNNTSTTRKGFYQHGLKADNSEENDSEPDLYFLNVNGATYKFTFGATLLYDPVTNSYYRKAVFFPDADIEIRVTYQHFIPWKESSINNNIGRFINWKVTMPDGMIYTFAGTPETIEATFEVEAKTAQTQNIYQEISGQPVNHDEILRYAKNNKVTSAWYVTKMESPFGNHIDFTYLPSKYAFFKLADQEAQTNNCTFSGLSQSINKVFVQASTLSKIESQTIRVLFNKETYSCIVNPNKGQEGEPDSLCKAISGNITRDDIDGWQKYPVGSQFFTGTNANKILNNIAVIDIGTGKTLDWTFEYENKISTLYDLSPNAYGYSTNEVGNTHLNRFFLKKIIFPNNNNYRLTYGSSNSGIPSRFTQRIDHWGYFNNPTFTTNTGLIGRDYTRPCVSVGTKRDTDNSGFYAQYYTLDSLISSTGSAVKFTYDNHEASNFSGKIGGSRIRQVETIDLISGVRTIKTYDYLKADGTTSSGFIALKPLYHFTDLSNNEFWNSGIYVQLLGQSGKPAVGYSRVVEKTITPSFVGSNNLGSTVTEYSQNLTEIDLVLPIGGIVTQSYTVRPWKNHFYQDYANGLPLSVKTYNSGGTIITEKTSNYGYGISDNSAINGYKSFRSNGQNYNFQEQFTEGLSKYRLQSEIVKAYSQDGTNPVENITTYTYKDQMPVTYKTAYPGKHNQVVKTESTDSYGYSNETFYKYAFDFNFGRDSSISYQVCYDINYIPVDCSSPNVEPTYTETYYNYFPHIPNDSEAKGIYQLQQKKIGAAVIETFAKKNGNVVAASYQNFQETATTEHQSGLEKESYVAENLPITNFTEAIYTRSTTAESFTKDSNYDLKVTIEKYNPLGMPQVIQTRFGARDSIVYDGTNTLILEKHSNISAYDENRIKMEYNPVLFGVSKEIATNDLEIRKEFYDDGRLKQIKDKDGKVLKHYQYYYRGQNDADPHLSTGNTHNRIITRVPRIATTDALSLDYDQCMISVSYMSGSGVTLQTVSYKASTNKKDMISGVTLFDEFGRPNKVILPIESNYDDGRYTHSGILNFNEASSKYPYDYAPTIQSVIEKARIFYNDDAPYTSIAEYENSPLSRAFKTYGVGKAWRDNSKYSEIKYETATGIKKFTVLYNSTTVTVGTYSDYVLTKKTLMDEQGNLIVEYTDKSGNLVQKDIQVSGTASNPVFLSTAYIFDDTGKIRYTLNPKAYSLLSGLASFDETHAAFEPNVYSYKYDGRFRVKEKKSPGIGTNKVIYNRLNQVCMSQDSHEALTNTYNYIKYDGQNRTAQTGQLTNTNSPDVIQGYFDAFTGSKQFEERSTASGNVQQYTNRSFPSTLSTSINDASLKTVTFFDDYDWRTNSTISGSIADFGFQANPYNASAYSATNARGLSTGGLSKIEIYGNFFFPATTYHDDKNRSIQSINYHNLLARNQSDVQYNFIGEILQNQMTYRKQGVSDHIRTIEQTLDNMGRRTEMYYTLKEGTTNKVARMKMANYAYDNIGRLKLKGVQPSNAVSTKQTGLWTDVNTWLKGIIPTINDAVVINQNHVVTVPSNQTATAGSLYDKGTLTFQTNSTLQMGTLPANQQGAALQLIEYSYNVRGQMRGLNLNSAGNLAASDERLFSYLLEYHETGQYFDGSIAKQSWLSKTTSTAQIRSYVFSYDKSNRLQNAIYSGASGENYSIPTITYDVNGNITFMSRMGKSGASTVKIDSLDYQYFNNGDKLKSVTDYAPNAQAEGFKNGTNGGDDYEYYPDGKLKKDLNRNIDAIEYNFLDLVSKISRGNGDYIEYKYTSTGEKRQTKRHIGGNDSYTLFDGEMIYSYAGTNPILNNFVVSEVQNEEGRFVNNRLEYGYTDHLGNLRLSYRDSSGVAKVVQSNVYDAWGMEIRSLRYLASGATKDKYSWQGKEDLSEDGLEDWSDFGWRIEDRTLGRWFTPDPVDQFDAVSTYAFVGNNPISRIDPDGREVVTAILVGALIGALTNTASQVIKNNGFDNWNWNSFGISVITGGIGGGLGAALSGSFGIGNTIAGSVFRGAAGGAISGGVTGGFASIFSGGNFWEGFANGALSGAIVGGIMNGGSFLKTRASFRSFQARTAGVNSLQPRGASALEVGADDGWGGGFSRPNIRQIETNFTQVTQSPASDLFVNPSGGLLRGQDGFGSGAWGASRDGGARLHQGIDILSDVNQNIESPFSGRLQYLSGSKRGVDIFPTDPTTGVDKVRILYVNRPASMVAGVNYDISAGNPIGTSAQLSTLGYPSGVPQHIHVQVQVNGRWVNPTPYFFPR